MPSWGAVLDELNLPENRTTTGPNYDKVRRKYLLKLFSFTRRPVIVYESGFLEKSSGDLVINLGDMHGFMNAVAGLDGHTLDLILHTPGGSPEATESIVTYLRTKFDDIRVFVPVAAMSAGTMLALGSDHIVMGRHSQLGPIDPQFSLSTPDGVRSAPGQAVLDQFEMAKKELAADPSAIAAWLPILRSYSPGLLAMCEDQRELGKRMVKEWLEKYMFRTDADRLMKAERAADWFANYQYFGSHSRRVDFEDVQKLELRASRLEDDQDLQDAVLTVHHCCTLTLSNTPCTKLIENHLGKAYVKMTGQVVVETGPPPQQQPSLPSRAERRRQEREQR